MEEHDEGPATKLVATPKTGSPQFRSHRVSLIDRYWDSWFPEVLAMCLSTACAVATAIILACYNGKPQPTLRYDITLNAIISILATASKALFIFAVSNSIGQLKWTWLGGRGTKPLIDAEIFDNASRGPLGALLMLTASTRKSIASFGAIVIILALALDPFVQQAVTYRTSITYTNSEGAVISVADSFRIPTDALLTKRAIGSVLYTNDFAWKPTCPTANCKWFGVESLAWHHRCFSDPTWTLSPGCEIQSSVDEVLNITVDDTSFLNHSCQVQAAQGSPVYHNVTGVVALDWSPLGDAVVLVGVPGYQVIATWDPSWQFTNSYQGNMPVRTADGFVSEGPMFTFGILNFTISFSTGQLELTTGVTCELDLSKDTFDLEYRNGLLATVPRATTGLRRSIWVMDHGSASDHHVYMCFEPNSTLPTNFTILFQQNQLEWSGDFAYASTKDGSQWCLTSGASPLDGLTDLLNSTLSSLIVPVFVSDYLLFHPGQRILDILKRDPYRKLSSGFPTDAFLAFGHEQIMENTAASLTMLTVDAKANSNGTRSVIGQAGETVNLVRVRWQWLILPYILCLGAILLLAMTIWIQQRTQAPLWKSSINAYFYHGIDFDMGIDTRLTTVPEMDAQAAATRVKLKPFGVHERLLLETTVVRRQVTDD